MTTKETLPNTQEFWNFNPDTGRIIMGNDCTRELEMGVNKPVKISWEAWWEKQSISVEIDYCGIVVIKTKEIKTKSLGGRLCNSIK